MAQLRAMRAVDALRWWFDAALRWWFKPPPAATRVTKVYAFNLGDPDDGFHEQLAWDPESFSGAGWTCQTSFEKARLEIRIVAKGRKRRVVLYPGDLCDTDFPTHAHAIVIQALFVAKEHATSMNVTKRVQKYLGNDLRSVHDMFPFDDHTDNADRFSHVRVVDLGMTVKDLEVVVPLALT